MKKLVSFVLYFIAGYFLSGELTLAHSSSQHNTKVLGYDKNLKISKNVQLSLEQRSVHLSDVSSDMKLYNEVKDVALNYKPSLVKREAISLMLNIEDDDVIDMTKGWLEHPSLRKHANVIGVSGNIRLYQYYKDILNEPSDDLDRDFMGMSKQDAVARYLRSSILNCDEMPKRVKNSFKRVIRQESYPISYIDSINCWFLINHEEIMSGEYKFLVEFDPEKLNELSLALRDDKGALDTSIYDKPTDTIELKKRDSVELDMNQHLDIDGNAKFICGVVLLIFIGVYLAWRKKCVT